MKFTNNITMFTFICVVLVSLCNVAQSDESADAASPSDYYAKFYQDYYNSIAGQEDTDRHTGYQEPAAVYHEPSYGVSSYDEGFDLKSMLGPDPGITLGLIGAVLGGIAVVGVGVLANGQSSLSNDQDSICTAVQQLGNLNIATENTATATTTLNQAALNVAIAAINGISTPDC